MTTETIEEGAGIDNRPAQEPSDLGLGKLADPLVGRAIELDLARSPAPRRQGHTRPGRPSTPKTRSTSSLSIRTQMTSNHH